MGTGGDSRDRLIHILVFSEKMKSHNDFIKSTFNIYWILKIKRFALYSSIILHVRFLFLPLACFFQEQRWICEETN